MEMEQKKKFWMDSEGLIFGLLVNTLILGCLVLYINRCENEDLNQRFIFERNFGHYGVRSKFEICSNLIRKSVSWTKQEGDEMLEEVLTIADKIYFENRMPHNESSLDSPEIDGPITIKNWNPFQDHYPLVEVSARAFDIEELFLGISCTHCQIDQINRMSTISEDLICHEIQVKDEKSQSCSNKNHSVSLILNLEAFDNLPSNEVETTLKYSIFQKNVLKSGEILDVNFKTLKSYSSKISQTKIYNGDSTFLESFSTIRVCFYFYKVCQRHVSRKKILEERFHGLCKLIDENLEFDFKDKSLIFKTFSTTLPRLYKYVEKYKKENVAYLNANFFTSDCL